MKKARAKKSTVKKDRTPRDLSQSYNRFKIYQGKQYTGMAVGRSHKWNYDPGIWIDKKITPEKWLINFEVKKRRAGKAPEGSGVPVGTEYHWYIVAHQMVKKLDANTYSTALNGLKFKLAHKRSDKEDWNISDKTQKKHLIQIFKDLIEQLEEQTVEEFIASQNMAGKEAVPRKSVPRKKRSKELT